jgi:hypothetical protein
MFTEIFDWRWSRAISRAKISLGKICVGAELARDYVLREHSYDRMGRLY